MFVVTNHAVPVGTEIQVDLVHPENGAVFALTGVVRRLAAREGLGIEFTDLDEGRRDALWQFIQSGLDELDVDVEVIEDDDPQLA